MGRFGGWRGDNQGKERIRNGRRDEVGWAVEVGRFGRWGGEANHGDGVSWVVGGG